MVNESTTATTASSPVRAPQVYATAVVCLVVGLAIGYLLRASRPSSSPTQPVAIGTESSASGTAVGGGQTHSPAEMKKMADRRVAELLEKLKSDPNNVAVLAEVAAIYHTSHQFKEAAVYYDRAVEVDPKDVAMRTKLASALYYSGDIDGAIAQLNKGLIYDPKDANSLFNLGLIKLQGKQDAKGALAAWRKLLKSNPQLSEDRKATVQQLMATALTMLSDQNGIQGARGNDGHKSDSN